MLDINLKNLCFCLADACDVEDMEQTESMITRMYFRHFVSNYQYRMYNRIVLCWYFDEEAGCVMTKDGEVAVKWVLENL